MLKATGAILVLVSAFAIGSLLAFRVKEQEYWLTDIKTTLFLLEGEMEYHCVPFPEAVQQVAKRHNGRLRSFLWEIGEELKKCEGVVLQDLWSQRAELLLKEAPLSKRQKEEFAEQGRYFTEADSKVRKQTMDFYLDRLEEEIIHSRKTGADKAYLYRTMGVLCGIFLLILAI